MSQPRLRPHWTLLVMFLACYTGSMLVFQLKSDMPPWEDGAPIEVFIAGLLWMGSVLALLTADWRLFNTTERQWTGLVWLLVCAVFALLALDETLRLHERTGELTGGHDDYIQVLELPAAIMGIGLLFAINTLSRQSRVAFVVGLLFHVVYIVTEVGDGMFFDLTKTGISISQLRWVEEVMEFAAIMSYVIGILFAYTGFRDERSA